MPTPSILIADDQPDVLIALRLLLKGEGYRVSEASSPQGVIDAIAKNEFDVVLMDMNYTRDTTSGREGIELLSKIKSIDDTLSIVVMTAFSTVDLAVEAMKTGADDFIQKPWDNTRLLSIVKTQSGLSGALRRGRRLQAENECLREEINADLIAESDVMKPVMELIERIGPSDANVLVLGENGTGKSLIAQALHKGSQRAAQPLITVNAGGLTEGVFASEFFGHVKGAFTDAKSDRIGRFELADKGTLFLDEIANVPPSQQTKLLRVLETGEFERVGSSQTRKADVRIISATNAEIDVEVQEGRFRQDLLFRLNTVEILLPPLRDRKKDIPLLAMRFMRQHAQRYRKAVSRFDDAAMNALLGHPWPGNIRELDHTVERAVLMAQGDAIRVNDLGLKKEADAPMTLEEMPLEEVERFLIKKTMSRCDGNVTKAAKTLGLSRAALYRRIEKYGV